MSGQAPRANVRAPPHLHKCTYVRCGYTPDAHASAGLLCSQPTLVRVCACVCVCVCVFLCVCMCVVCACVYMRLLRLVYAATTPTRRSSRYVCMRMCVYCYDPSDPLRGSSPSSGPSNPYIPSMKSHYGSAGPGAPLLYRKGAPLTPGRKRAQHVPNCAALRCSLPQGNKGGPRLSETGTATSPDRSPLSVRTEHTQDTRKGHRTSRWVSKCQRGIIQLRLHRRGGWGGEGSACLRAYIRCRPKRN